MRVIAINAMIVEAGRLSGIGHYTVQLALWFARVNRERGEGDRLLVYCRPAAAHHFNAIDGAELRSVPVGTGRIARVLAEQLLLPRLLRRDKVAAILNPAFTGPVRGAPIIVTTVHDPYFLVIPELLPRGQRLFLRAFVPFCCRRSTRVVTTAASTKRDLERYYPSLASKITVVPMANRLPGPASLPNAPSHDAKPFILLVAALTGNKNPGPLVAAIAELRQRYPDLTLLHVGKDPEGSLRTAVDRYNGSAWTVSLTGITDEELAVLYQQCLCVAVPSLCEGFGLPVLEAQAFGAPVISSDRGALPEVGGDGALYFNPVDVTEIANAIAQLIDEPERRQALRRAGFANQLRFSWEKTGRAMLEIMLNRSPIMADEHLVS